MPRINDRIGPYQLIRKLGRGGFGEVWLAKNVTALVSRNPEVALKIPHDDKVDIVAIKQEASIWLAASGHTNVLRFIEANIYDDYVVFVSEYVPDGSLRGWLEQHGGRAPSLEAGLEMTRGILRGLSHLHQPRLLDGKTQHIIHRDLKPDNVLLQGRTPLITDFGISRLYDATSQSAIIAGTIAYMAPEAFDGKRNQQTDVWSVGVMLYQMLAGHLPFTGQTNWEVEKAVQLHEAPPMPAAVPNWVQKVVAKALAKRPAERYQSAMAMLSDLQSPIPAPPAPEPHHIVIPSIDPLHGTKPSPPPPPKVDIVPDRIVVSKLYTENLNGVLLELIYIPAGKFIMGSDTHLFDEKPPHEVNVPGFYMGKFQVTQQQWNAIMGKKWRGLRDNNPSSFKGDDLPVERVSWHDAQAFCKKLREMTGNAYRLPSEAEWEYACRAGTTGDYAGKIDEMAWYDENSEGKTHPVGQKKPNAFGLYDMHGNVWEWCEDDWHPDYKGAPDDGSAWMGGEYQDRRVVRGGSWGMGYDECRSTYRLVRTPGSRHFRIGLRVAMSAGKL